VTGRVQLSVSTWQQPMPPSPSRQRIAVLDDVVDRILAFGTRRVRVAIDGFTAAGKTSFGHELARRVADAGRVALRASLDDFKRPWSESHLYDRVSGDGYYRNAFDTDAARLLLLDPAAPDGSGRIVLCSIDPLTQIDHSSTAVEMPDDGVLIVDGVFTLRPALNSCWDVRVWLHIDPELSIRRGTARDADVEGDAEQSEALHRDRYLVAETIYVNEVDPIAIAEVIIDNTDFTRPRLME
jgi:uridine kinase